MKRLVTYFSATGNTARVAETLAEAIGADVFEIRPEQPYTAADLDWRDSGSRSTLEMQNPGARPRLGREPRDLGDYPVIYVGFPIWWYVAPRIIKTFLEGCDLQGKTVIPFATSGGSGAEKVYEDLLGSCPGADLRQGSLLQPDDGLQDLAAWAEQEENR